MIENIKPYESSRDSGLIDRTRIPQHWKVLPTKGVFQEVNDRSSTGQETLLSVSHISGVRQRSDSNATMFLAKSNVGHKRCQPDDLVVNTMWAWMGALGVSPYSGIVSPAYAVYRQRQPGALLPKYADYLLRTPNYVAEYTSRSTGIHSSRLRMYPEAFFRAPLIIPPQEEQATIVRFLDRANRRIDQFIRAKKKLIALLNEQKQAIIHRAVTRGLSRDVKMKDSGVPWLGEIPAHWSVLRSKYLFREVDSRSLHGEETHLSMSQKHGLVPSSALTERRLMSESYAGGKLCVSGDLVLNRLKAHLGVFALAPQAGVISPDYTVLRPIAAMAPKYFEAVYRTPACRVVLRQMAKGIVQGFWRLYTDDFYNIAVPVPPADEQETIIDCLAQKLVGVQTALAQAEREIALMSEYRARLIADVVTGQLDVRKAAASLADIEPEAAPLESSDEETDMDDNEAP